MVIFNIAMENGSTYQHNPLQYRTAMAEKRLPIFPELNRMDGNAIRGSLGPQLCVLLEITPLNT